MHASSHPDNKILLTDSRDDVEAKLVASARRAPSAWRRLGHFFRDFVLPLAQAPDEAEALAEALEATPANPRTDATRAVAAAITHAMSIACNGAIHRTHPPHNPVNPSS